MNQVVGSVHRGSRRRVGRRISVMQFDRVTDRKYIQVKEVYRNVRKKQENKKNKPNHNLILIS